MVYSVEMYEKIDGKVPVLEFILNLEPKQQAKIYREIDLTEGKKMKWSEAKAIILKNNEVQNELEKNEAEYKIIEEIILARREKNLTQKGLAELIGTKQSNISRLESGNYNPSLDFLQKIASAMGKRLEVRMV